MINKHIVTLTGLLLTVISTFSQATVISYAGYSRDTTSDIVVGGGLEWLQWDVTAGLSINQAQTNYAADGWRVANNAEMSELYNSFGFGAPNATWWDSDASTSQSQSDNVPGIAHDNFVDLFGHTLSRVDGIDCCEVFEVHAYFGGDNPTDWNQAGINTDHRISSSTHNYAYLDGFSASADSSEFFRGVALVRNVTVPAPPIFLTFLLGIALLGLSRKLHK